MTSAIAGPARSRPVLGPGPAGAPAGIGPQPWLAHLVRHLPVARAGEDPEGVHQVRVACARLLVWLQMGGWRVLRDDLRWLRSHAARMRDLDVLRTEDGPALLPRFARTALRRGRALGGGNGSVAALHRLRCAVRRLRFALEWTGVEAPRVVELQEALGVVCDHATALRRLERGSGAAGEGPRAKLAQSLMRSRPVGAACLEEGAAPAEEAGLMELFLVRSSDGVAPRPGRPDEAKALSGRGRRRARRTARALAHLGASGARVLHSPRLRALETADILLRRLGGEGVACRGLDEAPSAELLAQMAGERVVVVGHEPWLGQLVAGLVLGAPRETRFRHDEAGVAWLEGEAHPGGMQMKALLPRRAVRSLGWKRKRKGKP